VPAFVPIPVTDRTFYLFIDIDGVMNRYGGAHQGGIAPDLVGVLGVLLSDHPSWEFRVVFNSAWNIHSMKDMVAAFVKAGFGHHSHCLFDQTNSSHGGGGPVRDYLTENGLVGHPFMIIDDETRDYGEMWCRLIRCDGKRGFDVNRVKAAIDLFYKVTRRPNEDRDRGLAVSHLIEHCHWLAAETPWLTAEQRKGYISADLDLVAHCLTVPEFRVKAMLEAPTPPA